MWNVSNIIAWSLLFLYYIVILKTKYFSVRLILKINKYMPYDVMLQWHLNPYFKKLEKLMLEINIPLRVVCSNVFKHGTV